MVPPTPLETIRSGPVTVAPPAEAGRGYRGGYHRGGGGGDALAAGLIGLGVGAVIGSALTPREVVRAERAPVAEHVCPA